MDTRLERYMSRTHAGHRSHKLSTRFCAAAIDIGRDVTRFALSTEKARFVASGDAGIMVEDAEPGQKFDGLIKYGTANNNGNATVQYSNQRVCLWRLLLGGTRESHVENGTDLGK